MSAERCLVIGGRGFVGSAMAARARSLGMDVTAVSREDYGTIVGQRFDVVVFAGGNARRYLAERDPARDLDANAGAVYRALRDVRTGCFVLASSVDVYTRPSDGRATGEDAPIDLLARSTYGFHKRLAELAVLRETRDFVIVRLGQMVGPGLVKGPVFDALRGDPLRVSPKSTYPFLRTETVARITFELVEQGVREIVNVCGRLPVRLADVLPGPLRAVDRAPTERYMIDVSKVASRCELPRSEDELRAFLEEPACSA